MKPRLFDTAIIGRRYGKLTVMAIIRRPKRATLFQCLCDCGKTTLVQWGNLYYLRTRSCGCARRLNNDHLFHSRHRP